MFDLTLNRYYDLGWLLPRVSPQSAYPPALRFSHLKIPRIFTLRDRSFITVRPLAVWEYPLDLLFWSLPSGVGVLCHLTQPHSLISSSCLVYPEQRRRVGTLICYRFTLLSDKDINMSLVSFRNYSPFILTSDQASQLTPLELASTSRRHPRVQPFPSASRFLRFDATCGHRPSGSVQSYSIS